MDHLSEDDNVFCVNGRKEVQKILNWWSAPERKGMKFRRGKIELDDVGRKKDVGSGGTEEDMLDSHG